MKPKVYVARKVPPEVKAYLTEHCDCEFWESREQPGRERFFAAMADAEGLLTTGTPVNDELLDHAPRLRIVSNISVGYDNFDVEAMKRRGVMGTHTPGVLDDTVADLAMALILAAARRVAELDRLVRKGGWVKGMNEELFGVDVHHATLGIIGMGRIGEAVAKRARLGFDMEVLYHNRSRKPEAEARYGAVYVSLDELLARSDFVVVLTPLTPETKKMIGREQLARMKPTAILVNVSRGAVVDEAALVEALRSGTIRGAALDVFEREPVDPDNPLLAMDNVVLLPHIGSATARTRAAMAMLAARNLVAGLRGETPPNLVPELKDLAPGRPV
ncbi:MAG TPA: D-glycerate dehydrogenase [Paenibacillaceae bacterium]